MGTDGINIVKNVELAGEEKVPKIGPLVLSLCDWDDNTVRKRKEKQRS